MEHSIYYVSKLKEQFFRKQKNNPNYSLRAFSRDLDIHGSTLSQIFKGKRGLPFNRANDVANKLKLTPKERTLFMESFFKAKPRIDNIKIDTLNERFILDESYSKIISEWEHYAVLEFFNLAYYDLSPKAISYKLGININRAETVLQNLITCGLLIKNKESDIERAYPDIRTTEDIKSSALKKSHKETLEIGLKKLEEIATDLRDFSSTTIAIDLNKLLDAKTIIREFRQKMIALLKNGNKTDIYQLAVQFYPLSKVGDKK